jgi:hypothetical protein
MALAANQQVQYDQLLKAGASQQSAMNAAMLVPVQQAAPSAPIGTTGSTAMGATNTPVAQTPPTPTPQIATPPAPAANPAQTTPASNATPQGQQAPQGGLAMPANGSVVDLLNAAGQDSSFAARQQLAQQYGIQGYTGTAAQNQDLSKKYLAAYNANKGGAAPQSGAQASAALDQFFKDNPTEQTKDDPTKSFMDAFAGMDPIQANIYQQLSTALSSTQTQQSLSELWQQTGEEFDKQTGIARPDIALMDINRIMEGTEDDIRDEISMAGGSATESQVQAMTGARNKTLLKQATYLSNVLQAKNDYVDRVVSLTQADRKQVSDDLDRKLGISKTLFDMSQSMTNAAKDNYKMIVDSVGWEGLAQSMSGNKAQMAKVEKLFGMAPGELQALAKYKKPLSEKETLDLENQRLQNQKLRGDINAGPSIKTQVVDINGKKVLINSDTGAKIADIEAGGAGADVMQLAVSQQQINTLDNLIQDSYLGTAVGPNPAARASYLDIFTGGKSNFIASIEQIRNDLTIDKLAQAKGSGVTFGALSDQERIAIAAAATKLGSVAIKDEAGNVLGYDMSEKDFKTELDVINNFAKLDFVLKGGDPSAVGIVTMDDGTLWTENSNGTKVRLR